jgi:DNA-binding SARP family transcriptional activator
VRATLLGPVSAQVGDTELSLGGLKQRAVFALLALNAGHVVTLDRLVDELWSDEPPSRATLVLQSYVSRLRRVLAQARKGGDEVPTIVTRPPGWLLTLAPDRVDATRFASLVAQARRLLATGEVEDAAEAAGHLQTALGLWVGDALTDLESLPFAREEAARLHDLRLSATELQLEAMLVLGESDTVADEARRLVRTSPLRERAWGALMLGLYRAGRQAEAVAAAAQLRRTLADELGLDPSPEVRDLEERILRQDPALGSRPAGRTVPRQATRLRAPPLTHRAETGTGARLVGRDDVLSLIEQTVDAAVEGRGRLLVVPAPAGLGKSSILSVIGDLVRSAGGVAVSGGGVGGGGMPALWPWVSIVRGLAAHAAGTDDAHPPSERDLAGSAAALLQGAGASARTDPGGGPGLDRTSLYRGVIDLLARERAAAPLAVLVDDAQWVDCDTLTLLSLAVDELVQAGVVFAVAFRSDEPSTADVLGMVGGVRRELATRIELRGLHPAEVAEVMRDLSGADPDPDVAAAIQARTAGHPLFVTELVRLLSSERRLDAEGVSTALPRQIREVLHRRLERLPEQTVALLAVVAVAGAADVDLLSRVTGLDADAVIDSCESALVAGLLVEDPGLADAFALSHDLVRQTIEESLSSARRIRLHAKVAATLQARGELTPQQIVDVAHHLLVAAPVVGPAAAIPYLVAASEDALSRFANDHAEQNLTAALDLARQVRDPAERAALERQMQGRLAIFLGYTRGRLLPPHLRDGVRPAPPPKDAESTAGWLGTAIMTGVAGDYAATIALAEHALVDEVPPVTAVAAHYALGWAQFVLGRVDAARHEFATVEELMSGIAIDVPGLFVSVAVTTPCWAALIAHVSGDDAGADARIALGAARATGSDLGNLHVALLRSWLAAMRRDVMDARSNAADCARLSERLDYPLFPLHARIIGGWADTLAGDVAGAERADAAYGEYHAAGVRLFQPFYLLLRAEAHAETGDAATAARLVIESRAVSAGLGDVCLSPRLTAFADALVPPASRPPPASSMQALRGSVVTGRAPDSRSSR